MKRFLLFGSDDYYPMGGMNDFTADFDTLQTAIEKANSIVEDWQEIYDQHERKEVWTKSKGLIKK